MKLSNIFKIPKTKYTAKEILKWLWVAWKGNRLQASLNALIGLLGVIVSLSSVWAVQHAIDVASHEVKGEIITAVLLMGVLILCDFALNITSVWIRNLLGIKAQNRMQQKLLDRILRSEWKGKESHHSGDVLNRLEIDVANVVNFLTEIIPNSLSTLALFLGAFFYLFAMDWRLAIVIVIMIPIFVVFSKIYMRQMRHLTSEVRNSDSKVQSILQETIQHRMLIKTLEGDSEAVNRLEGTQSVLRNNIVRRTKFSVFSYLVLNLGFSIGYLIAFGWAAIRLSAGTLTFGGMTAFLQLVNRIQSPARQLTRLVPSFVSVFTAAERLMELEEDPLEEQGDSIVMDSPCGVRFKNVTFAYEDSEDNVIEHLNYDFYPGSCTAILGETGSGKTTLVRIILALLKPMNGMVEIYNKLENKQLSPLLRTNFVYVPQGNTLMSGTIRDNLRLGKITATDEEMKKALKQSCAEFVFDLPNGLETECTEQGGGLSEGQAQRISIARALLRNRSIMLFDEATSALDPETERQLLKNLLEKHDKTIIFITHRPAVVEYCDQTLTIEKQQPHV
ncbi:ABC transporter, ATP-binding protein [Prevotella disiens JCM 6334 = ATCC 29426]|uniref:Multidrug export ATP-binding/permease protein SAV1866 n=2 Tax=Prevotella disiens TaxID=28130 RepID=A0A379DWH6_9BACT|nr:ABC transporter ATP-binding protein [Prevotella disiens]ERJ79340.1 ABC transporter, ATP-binding protein [Prevotella disiens JCM 6334 = ATCC 29426]SUB84689.1 Putative multidrug export ATP-binding/permease protein SAV1866 [Prevotella disiens]